MASEIRPRSRRRRFFWLALALVLMAIAATLLLARDMENLRTVMARLGMPMAPRTMTIPKPGQTGIFKPGPIRSKTVMLDPYVFMPEIRGQESGLMRTVLKSGPALCDVLRQKGIAVSPWQKSQLAAGMECFAETILPNPEKPDEPSSFFLMIKGTPSGALVSARLKIVFSSLEGRAAMIAKARTAMAIFAEATLWRDIDELSGKIERLEPFATDQFGVNIRFQAEFGGPGRYNLIITMVPGDDGQKRTARFFARENFLPLPANLMAPAIP